MSASIVTTYEGPRERSQGPGSLQRFTSAPSAPTPPPPLPQVIRCVPILLLVWFLNVGAVLARSPHPRGSAGWVEPGPPHRRSADPEWGQDPRARRPHAGGETKASGWGRGARGGSQRGERRLQAPRTEPVGFQGEACAAALTPVGPGCPPRSVFLQERPPLSAAAGYGRV